MAGQKQRHKVVIVTSHESKGIYVDGRLRVEGELFCGILPEQVLQSIGIRFAKYERHILADGRLPKRFAELQHETRRILKQLGEDEREYRQVLRACR